MTKEISHICELPCAGSLFTKRVHKCERQKNLEFKEDVKFGKQVSLFP